MAVCIAYRLSIPDAIEGRGNVQMYKTKISVASTSIVHMSLYIRLKCRDKTYRIFAEKIQWYPRGIMDLVSKLIP